MDIKKHPPESYINTDVNNKLKSKQELNIQVIVDGTSWLVRSCIITLFNV